MTSMKFHPENELENAIVKAKQGAISMKDMMKVFFRSYIYVVSLNEISDSDQSIVHEDWSNFFPLRFDVDGQPMAAVFSSLSKAQSYSHKSEHILKIRGREHILRIPPDNGIVLNAGYDAQIKVMPSGVVEMKEHLKKEKTAEEKLVDFKPENALEKAILDAGKDILPTSDMLDLLADSDIYVSSKGVIDDDWTGFHPLLFDHDKETLVAVFSSETRPVLHRLGAKYILKINAREFVKRLAPRYGLIMNPGYFAYFMMPAGGVAEYREKLAKR